MLNFHEIERSLSLRRFADILFLRWVWLKILEFVRLIHLLRWLIIGILIFAQVSLAWLVFAYWWIGNLKVLTVKLLDGIHIIMRKFWVFKLLSRNMHFRVWELIRSNNLLLFSWRGSLFLRMELGFLRLKVSQFLLDALELFF